MARLKITKSSPLATIQDEGRFGYRQFGIPQSGAMDSMGMKAANQLVGNNPGDPLIEYALTGLTLEILEDAIVGLYGADLQVNGQEVYSNASMVKIGDVIRLSPPNDVYAYFSIGGRLQAQSVFESYSTYLPGGFGGLQGRSLKSGDELITNGDGQLQRAEIPAHKDSLIRFMPGPEWDFLVEPFEQKNFQIDPSSNRIGIRLQGAQLESSRTEIKSSAVIPGTIQLPPNGHPIILMNDCQTTGGYARIGKVLDEDLGRLAQIRPGEKVMLKLGH